MLPEDNHINKSTWHPRAPSACIVGFLPFVKSRIALLYDLFRLEIDLRSTGAVVRAHLSTLTILPVGYLSFAEYGRKKLKKKMDYSVHTSDETSHDPQYVCGELPSRSSFAKAHIFTATLEEQKSCSAYASCWKFLCTQLTT